MSWMLSIVSFVVIVTGLPDGGHLPGSAVPCPCEPPWVISPWDWGSRWLHKGRCCSFSLTKDKNNDVILMSNFLHNHSKELNCICMKWELYNSPFTLGNKLINHPCMYMYFQNGMPFMHVCMCVFLCAYRHIIACLTYRLSLVIWRRGVNDMHPGVLVSKMPTLW